MFRCFPSLLVSFKVTAFIPYKKSTHLKSTDENPKVPFLAGRTRWTVTSNHQQLRNKGSLSGTNSLTREKKKLSDLAEEMYGSFQVVTTGSYPSDKNIPRIKIVPENGWLGDDPFILPRPIFKGELLVSGRVHSGVL